MVEKAKSLLTRANSQQTLTNAAALIAGAYLVSRLLGLVRDALLFRHFQLGPELSAYYAAFRLPEMLFTLLVSGAFAVAFIPVLTEHLEKNQREQAWRVMSSLLNILVLATLIGGVLIIIFADPLTRLVAPGFDDATHELSTNLTRIMAITPVLFAISSVLGSVQQAFNRFLIFSLAGVLYNLGIIVGILALTGPFGIYGAAWGVVLGVVLQALLQWLGLYGLGIKYQPILTLKLEGVRTTLKLMFPRSIDQGIDQINYSVETVIGSTISANAIAQFSVASNLKNVPLALIGSSITTAIFPRLASNAAKGQREQLVDAYVSTARMILFLAIPAALFAVVSRGYLVRMIVGDGDQVAANTLGWFAGSIVFTSLFFLISRVYYALQDTRTPLYLSLASIPLNIILSFILSKMFGVEGLAMSASIVAVLETIALGIILRVKYGSFGERTVFSGAWRMVLAATFMMATTYLFIINIVPLYAVDLGLLVLLPKFLLILLVGSVAYLIPCYVMQLKEAKHIIARTRDMLARSLNLT